MYASGRGNAAARRFARMWNAAFRLGVLPRRWVTLEVRGARSGDLRRFPLGMADVNGRWYLVSMLGECAWVRNVRAAHGHAALRRLRSHPCLLEEVEEGVRGPILKRYVERVPGARPHVPVAPGAPVEEFRAVAADYPVFLVIPEGDLPGLAPR